MTLWSAQQAALATGGQAVGDWAVTGVSIDTRTLQTGDLFVALKAARDGHDFVANALAAGAGAALVSRVPDGVDDTAPLLIVPDVQAALEDLGRAARARTKAKVIAVTGSVGKTSTKEMLRHMLGACGKTHASVASYNNHWGVPLTLARMPADTEFAVIEIGMNHPGEIAPLAKMAAPDVAMVTTVAEVHLEAFDDINGIALEKASIIDGLVPNGVAIMNADTPCTKVIETYTKDVTTRWFGAAADDASLSGCPGSGRRNACCIAGRGRNISRDDWLRGTPFCDECAGCITGRWVFGGRSQNCGNRFGRVESCGRARGTSNIATSTAARWI